MDNRKVLFVTYGGGHVNMVVPVAKLLMQKKNIHIDIFALTTARKVIEKEGISCFSCRDLAMNGTALFWGQKLFQDMGGGHPDIPDNESIAYLGLSYLSLIEKYGEREAELLYQEHGRQAFNPVFLMEEIILKGGYHLVVATNSPRMERAAIEAAGRLDVFSLCMVDLFALQEVEWIGQKGYANKICVLSETVKHMLCEAGRARDEVVVTGNPIFDRLADAALKQKAIALRKNKGWEGKKIILWCSQPEPKTHPFTGEKGDPKLPFKIEKKLKNICVQHEDEEWKLFVRPHPSENMDERLCIEGVSYSRKDDLSVLLKAVDVIVVMSSTVGLEAALLGRPVVALNMSIFSADMPLSDMGMALGVDDLNELNNVIEQSFFRERTINSNLPKIGGAAQMISNELYKLLN